MGELGGEDGVDAVIRILNTVLDDDGLQVRRLAGASKGLFATQRFQRGEVLWQEPPLLAAHTFGCPVPACRHCLRALRDGEDVACQGSCGHRYCSDTCQAKARMWYHHVVCSCDGRDPSRGERLRDFEIFARDCGNEYYGMAATGVASAIAGSEEDLDGGADDDAGDDELDARLAEHVRCWFRQFEQRPWWQTLSSCAHKSSLMTEAEDAARAGNFELSKGDRRKVFEMDVEEQTREALSLLLRAFPPRLRACLDAPQQLHREYARLIGALRMNSQHIAAPNPQHLRISRPAAEARQPASNNSDERRDTQEGAARTQAVTVGEAVGNDRRAGGWGGGEGGGGGQVAAAGGLDLDWLAEIAVPEDSLELGLDFVSGIALFRIHSCINHR